MEDNKTALPQTSSTTNATPSTSKTAGTAKKRRKVHHAVSIPYTIHLNKLTCYSVYIVAEVYVLDQVS